MTGSQDSKNLSRLVTLVATALTMAILHFAREILLPITLAMLFTFLLTPLVVRLERWHLGRIPSVLLVVAFAFVVIGGVGYVVTKQLVELSEQLPAYKDNLITRARALRGGTEGRFERVTRTIEEIGEEFSGGNSEKGATKLTPEGQPTETSSSNLEAPPAEWLAWMQSRLDAEQSGQKPAEEAEPVMAVRVVEIPPSPINQISTWLGPLVGPLATAGMVVVLVIFFLLGREDLRNRLIQLFGRSHLHATTEAFNDAASRVSRYLRMQLLVNSSYGVAVAIGLAVIGLPNAFLWGVLGLCLRFLPYIGPWLSAVMPIFLSLAIFTGWTVPLLTIGLFLVLELVVNNVIEPLAYGSSIGVSTVGIIIAAIFWTWMWGPVGLVLAVPLTVCLIVMGHYIPPLRFISVLFGDQATLSIEERMYQRLLAFDYDEAYKLAQESLRTSNLGACYDQVMIPTLFLAERDRHAELLSEKQERFVLQAARELIEDLEEAVEPAEPPPEGNGRVPRIFLVPVGDQADEIATEMLSQLLLRRGVHVEEGSLDMLVSETVERVAEVNADAVVISAMPPLATRDGRLLCRRLRARYPSVPIVVGLWNGNGLVRTKQRLIQAGASEVVTGLEAAATKAIVAATNAMTTKREPVTQAQGSSRV